MHISPSGAKRAFTLIELLVVIAIIGILSSVVLASLNTARAKSRDARRQSDLKQMANAIAINDAGSGATALGGCTGAGVKANTCTTPNLSQFSDPSSGAITAACAVGGTAVCQYAIGSVNLATGNPTTNSFEICAYFETAAAPLSAPGMVHIDQNGTIIAGCI